MESLIVISISETMWKLKKRMKLQTQKSLLLAKTWTRIWISIQFGKLQEKLSKLSFILRVKERLKMSENRVLRRIFGPKREKVI
jgi:hypothetical protein